MTSAARLAIAVEERDEGRLAERPDGVVRVEAARLQVSGRRRRKVAALERANRPDAAHVRLQVRLRGDVGLDPSVDLVELVVGGQTTLDQEEDLEPDQE